MEILDLAAFYTSLLQTVNIFSYRYCLPSWEISRCPGQKLVPLCSLTFERRQANPFHEMQIIYVGSNQSVGFRTQQGETYGQNTKCKVHFKVSWRKPFFETLKIIKGLVQILLGQICACSILIDFCNSFSPVLNFS